MYRRLLICVVVSALAAGCTLISVLSGPRTLSAGDTATYVLALGGTSGASPATLYVVADVPDSWALLSSWYTATIGGVPVSGSGTVVGDCETPLPPVGDGFQRFCIEDEFSSVGGGDSGEMTLDFAVTDVPEGEFVLKFWFFCEGIDGTTRVGPPAYAEINREPGIFRFAEALALAAGALEENFAVATSNDGRSVVLGGHPVADISVVDRDPLTGALSHNHYLDEGSLDGVDDLAFAPGDQQAYGVDGQHLACFQRDAITGQLSVSQILEDDVGGVDGLGGAHRVAISPDGASVYVSAESEDAVSVFDRDPSSGGVSFVEAHFNLSGGIDGMNGPAELAVSPDGANLYVAGYWDDSIVVFDRHPTDGSLTYSQTLYASYEVDRPWGLVAAPDGGHVYATGLCHWGGGCVGVFSRDPMNGQLSLVEVQVEGDGNLVGLIDPTDLALSPDGRYVFVSASGSLVVFSRDPASGGLTFLNADFNLEGGVTGIPRPYQIEVSSDGTDVFYSSSQSMAVFTARSFADGFESGDTSAWSATHP